MIDFVAYHDLQAQCGKSVYTELIKTHECTWRINPNQKYQGSDTLVMLDHAPHHPDLFGKYKYKFYMFHDIGEFNCLMTEKEYIKQYSAILAPTRIHKELCEKLYPDIPCYLVGWSKYDYIKNKSMSAEDIIYRLKRIYEAKILYAPTNPHTYEWIELIPELKKRGTVLIKNHILLNEGQDPPRIDGNEEYNAKSKYYYSLMQRSINEMEEYAKCHGITVVPRRLNACELFEDIDILVSDTSSLLAEFLPFGVASVETGRVNDNPHQVDRLMSEVFQGIITMPEFLADKMPQPQDVVKYDSRLNVGRQIADIIREYIT